MYFSSLLAAAAAGGIVVAFCFISSLCADWPTDSIVRVCESELLEYIVAVAQLCACSLRVNVCSHTDKASRLCCCSTLRRCACIGAIHVTFIVVSTMFTICFSYYLVRA